jgi:hypothetical protein
MSNEKRQVVIKNDQLMVEGVKSGKGEPLSFYNLKLKQKEPYTSVSDIRIVEITGPNASRFYVQGTGSDGTNVSRSISAEGAQVVMEFFGLGDTEKRAAKPRKPRKNKRSPPAAKPKATTRKTTRKTTGKTTRKTTGKTTRKTKGKTKATTRKTSAGTKTKTTRKSRTTPTRKTTRKNTRKTSPEGMSKSSLMGMKRSELMEMARGLPGFTDKMTKAQYIDLIMASPAAAESTTVRTSRRTLSPRTGRRTSRKSPTRKSMGSPSRGSPSRSPRGSPSPRRSSRRGSS